MFNLKTLKSVLLSFTFLITAYAPLFAQANNSFSPIVKIISYRHNLNGTIVATGTGSGSIIGSRGEVLTNAHVVYDEAGEKPWDAFAICVTDDPQELPVCRFTASLERYDNKIDLAILKIDKEASWGTTPSTFSRIAYKEIVTPEVNESVTVQGYPGSGGGTINITQGQVSGFDELNGYHYLKTDADIDAGNSGGAMFSESGDFIGVPSFIVSDYANSGRVLAVAEVEKWVDSENGQEGVVNHLATKTLRDEYNFFYLSKENHSIAYKVNPKIKAEFPRDWALASTAPNSFVIYKPTNSGAVVAVSIFPVGFKYNFTLEEQLELYEKLSGKEPENYQFTTLDELDVVHVWEDVEGGVSHVIMAYNGHKAISINYTVPEFDEMVILQEVNEFLASFEINYPDEDDMTPNYELDNELQPIKLKAPKGDWRVVTEHLSENKIAEILTLKSPFQTMEVYYDENVDADDLDLKDALDYEIENYVPEDSKVEIKSTKLVLDGMPGWLVLHDYMREGYPMKKVAATILVDNKAIYIDYKSEVDTFDEGLASFIEFLSSIEARDEDLENKGTYNIPLPGGTVQEGALSDIGGHRYMSSIENLVDMEVIGGYPDGTFKPENPVNRAEALKIILQSLRSSQSEDDEESGFEMPADFDPFSDMNPSEWYATYVAEGMEKGMVKGYPDGTFKGGNTVNLAEALKMTFIAHDVQVWDGESDPWYKKYFDAAYDLDLLPRDLEDPAKPLTRAELAYIVDQLVNN